MQFIIPKGRHRPTRFIAPSFHFGRTFMAYTVTFDPSCLAMPLVDCRDSWNKLFGFSYGWHQTDSIRFAWRSVGERIEVGAYLYEQGKRRDASIYRVLPDQPLQMEMHLYSDNYVRFEVDGVSKLMKWSGRKPCFGYSLFPYYGGHCPAPCTVKITVTK